MTLKTIRDPTLPAVPPEEEKDDFDRTTRFRKGQLFTFRDLQESVYDDLKDLKGYEGSATWDPGSIANGAVEAKEVTVTGAELGDFAIASFSLDVSDLILDAQVTAVDTVTCILANNIGGAINLGSGTVKVRVFK